MRKLPLVNGDRTYLAMVTFLSSCTWVTVIDSRLHLSCCRIIVIAIMRIFWIAAIDGDAVIDEERGIQNITVLGFRTLGGVVFSCCDINGTLRNAVGQHVLVQAVDGLLQVIHGVIP